MASASFGCLQKTVREIEKAGVDYIHFDIEDGVFVPIMNLGTKIINDLRLLTNLPFDVHLMMVNPEWIIPQLKSYGIDRVSFHHEATQYPRRLLKKIFELGMKGGIALNPKTSIPDIRYLQPYLSFVVLLTTEPEGENCPFLPSVLSKMEILKQMDEKKELEYVVDGGISKENVGDVIKVGADFIVVGRSAFKDGRVIENIEELRNEIERTQPCKKI